MRSTSFFLAVGLAVAPACGALAQAPAPAPAPVPAPLGAVVEVRGLVTMSFGSQVATVQPQTPVFDGARFVTSSSGDAELKLQSGCALKLAPNQWVQIDGGLTCAQQVSAIQTLTDVTGAASMFARNSLPLLGSAAMAAAVAKAKVPEPEITPRPR